MKKQEQLDLIVTETIPVIKWECPVCGDEHVSEDDATQEEFADFLYKEGVRWKRLEYMEGVMCKNCYNDPDVQKSSL